MGPIALLLIGLAGWLLWTGRLQRMTAKDGMMLGLAIVGAVTAAKGKPLIGALPMLLSVAYAAVRIRKPSEPAAPMPKTGCVEEAQALLGLPENPDEAAIRAAHRRLIGTVHPDKGGTQALAAKINAARDVLLQHYAVTHMHNKEDSDRKP
jgi:hypothetical protein